jgi:hypothetical protein
MTSFSLLMLLIAAAATIAVQATLAPVYIFDEQDNVECNQAEWNTVMQAMINVTTSSHPHRGRRRLGQVERKLQTCPSWCGKYCAAMGIGCVQKGRRRQLRCLQDNQDEDEDGKDQNIVTTDKGGGGGGGVTRIQGDVSACAADIAAIDAVLKSFTAVSKECQQLLMFGNKTISCPDFTTVDCYIKGISAWQFQHPKDTAPTVLIPKMNATGANFCRNSVMVFLVDTNFVVGKVTMSLWLSKTATGPMKLDNMYEEGTAPYYAFGRSQNPALGLQVHSKRFLTVGWYKLTVMAADNPTDVKTVSFTVTNC